MNILIAVTGSIAAYKTPSIVSILVNNGHSVKVMMTKSAEDFVTRIALSAMSRNHVYTDDNNSANDGRIHHIELAQWADVIAVVPASYNTLSKIILKLADNLVTSTIAALPSDRKLLIFPAMNVHMWNNIKPTLLQGFKSEVHIRRTYMKDNITVFEPASGKQACGDVGLGKLLSTKNIVELIENHRSV